MINKQFALGTWEIHLLDKELRQKLYSSDIFSYIDTAIDYNNDYLLADTSTKIISKISSYHTSMYDFFVDNHLKCLKRDYIDIMLIHSSRGNWQELANKLKTDTRFKEIGVSNFNISEIEEFKTIVGYYPKYNEIEINPLYTDIETVEFCKKNNIKIISYGVIGGKYLAQKMVAEYSLPYLLMYASQHADIIIVKPESNRHLIEYTDCKNNLILNYKSVQYYPTNSNSDVDADNKQIVPMRYFPPKINKTFYGELTYHISCGKNFILGEHLNKTKLELNDMPNFEMLGDYQTFIRYKFRQNYNGSPVYDYDFLIGDDGNYYVIYIFDDSGYLTKVYHDNIVEVYKYEKF